MYLEWSPSSWDFAWGVEVGFAPRRSLAICSLVNRKLQRKSAPEVTRFRPRPLRSREKEILIDAFLSSSSILDFDAILDYSFDGFIFSSSLPDPKVLVSFEPSDWWRGLVKIESPSVLSRKWYHELLHMYFVYIYFQKEELRFEHIYWLQRKQSLLLSGMNDSKNRQ